MLVNYESLPGIVPRIVLPMFGIIPGKKWLTKMASESAFYSKSRGNDRKFLGDSVDKDERATMEIQEFAKSILEPTFSRLNEASSMALQRLDPVLSAKVTKNGALIDWKILNTIPTPETGDTAEISATTHQRENVVRISDRRLENNLNGTDGTLAGHSRFPPMPFAPWVPFANTHESKSFEVEGN